MTRGDGGASRRRLAALWVALAVAATLVLYGLRLDPGPWTAWGDRQLRHQHLVEAERAYRRALAIDPDHAPALYGLGWAYLRSGLTGPAQDQFQHAVDVAPEFAGGHRGLAALEAARGKSAAAEERLRHAHQLDPRDAGVLADLAVLYVAAGHLEPGLELLERAMALRPRRAEFRLTVAEACVDAGFLDEARRQLDLAGSGRTMDRRYGSARDEIELRLALARLDALVEPGTLPEGGCREARALVDAAQGRLDEAMRRGLDGGMRVQDGRRLEAARNEIRRLCGGG